jgi:hypothetical protein
VPPPAGERGKKKGRKDAFLSGKFRRDRPKPFAWKNAGVCVRNPRMLSATLFQEIFLPAIRKRFLVIFRKKFGERLRERFREKFPVFYGNAPGTFSDTTSRIFIGFRRGFPAGL